MLMLLQLSTTVIAIPDFELSASFVAHFSRVYNYINTVTTVPIESFPLTEIERVSMLAICFVFLLLFFRCPFFMFSLQPVFSSFLSAACLFFSSMLVCFLIFLLLSTARSGKCAATVPSPTPRCK